MAREFPEFLFSDPKNTKSEGPFIVHTIFPKKIFKVTWLKNQREGENNFCLYDLKKASDDCTEKESADTIRAAERWILNQLKSGSIKNPMNSGKGYIVVFDMKNEKTIYSGPEK